MQDIFVEHGLQPMPDLVATPKGAIFSKDRSRRYLLWREVDIPIGSPGIGRVVLFVGLNPSIADEVRLDPTVTRCYNYAKRWGYGYLMMGNLYSKVSTDPKGVDFSTKEGEGHNWQYLLHAIKFADKTILCWGANADDFIATSFLYLFSEKTLYCLGKNSNGSPKHPLYLRGDLEPQVYLASAAGRFKAGQWE